MPSKHRLSVEEQNPLSSIYLWEDRGLSGFPGPDMIATQKSKEAYRNYNTLQRDAISEFYRLNHYSNNPTPPDRKELKP